MNDLFDLRRFVDAQATVYRQIVKELSHGRKQTHWMWFIFPQIAGLGFSAMAQRFAIGSRAEAAAYLEHDPSRTAPGRMHASCHGRERKDHNRHSGLPGRHQIPVVHDAVRRRLEAGDFRGSYRGLLFGREGPCDLGTSGNEPTLVATGIRGQKLRRDLVVFHKAQKNRLKIVIARDLRNHDRGPRSPAKGGQVARASKPCRPAHQSRRQAGRTDRLRTAFFRFQGDRVRDLEGS
jgi:hypothetical protein